MAKDYMIYKMENPNIHDEVYYFFLPERGVSYDIVLDRKVKRHLELIELNKKGYEIAGILYVDKEEYLNTRLNVAVDEYCKLDREEQEIKSRMYSYYTSRTMYQTLELIKDRKWTLAKKIAKLVRRLMKEDLSVYNEIALALSDRYLDSII